MEKEVKEVKGMGELEVTEKVNDPENEKSIFELLHEQTGLVFTNISHHSMTKYTLSTGESFVIKSPIALNVTESVHRVLSSDGVAWFINPEEGWYIQWTVKEGTPFFNF